MLKLSGRAWKYGDDINTDYIIPGRYMELTDPKEMAKHAMEGIDSSFAQGVKEGDIIIAGTNFGCGSSREHAPLALKYAGLGCVLADSYARIFYRNAINIGLPALECTGIASDTETSDMLEVDLSEGVVRNLTRGTRLKFKPMPPFMVDVLNSGGLVPYLRKVEEW